jgi:hypothetical protein
MLHATASEPLVAECPDMPHRILLTLPPQTAAVFWRTWCALASYRHPHWFCFARSTSWTSGISCRRASCSYTAMSEQPIALHPQHNSCWQTQIRVWNYMYPRSRLQASHID